MEMRIKSEPRKRNLPVNPGTLVTVINVPSPAGKAGGWYLLAARLWVWAGLEES